MKKAPEVLTRMRLSCCWGDNLNVEELNEIVDYINNLERQCKKQKEVIDKAIEYLEEPNRDSFDYSKALLLDILQGRCQNEYM